MMGRGYWTLVIQWTAWAVAMAVLMGWLARSRLKHRNPVQSGVLEYPSSMLALGGGCIAVLLCFAVLSSRSNDPRDAHLWIVFVGFALLGAPIVAEYFVVRHVLLPEGLQYTPLVKKSGSFRWNDVAHIRYSPSAKWFRIDLKDGRVVRISAMLMGLPEFASAVLHAVPPSSIDPLAGPVIERTAAGNPPSIWGE